MFDLFDDAGLKNVAPKTPAEAMREALKRGDLLGVMKIIEPMNKQETQAVLLSLGFALTFERSKAGLLASVQKQLLDAAAKKLDGYELRELAK